VYPEAGEVTLAPALRWSIRISPLMIRFLNPVYWACVSSSAGLTVVNGMIYPAISISIKVVIVRVESFAASVLRPSWFKYMIDEALPPNLNVYVSALVVAGESTNIIEALYPRHVLPATGTPPATVPCALEPAASPNAILVAFL
jgi:hypothetical protein